MRALQRSVSAVGKRSREGLDVRLLTAVDMHGVSGRPVRARLVLGEFVVAAAVRIVSAQRSCSQRRAPARRCSA